MALQLQQPASRLFSSLHARLMVRIDVNQRSVKADGALIQSDQSTHRKWRYSINANGNRFPIPFEKGRASTAQKSLKVIATGNPRLHLEASAIASGIHLNECNEEITHTVSELLNISMMIG